jgi:hypothetical protein
VSTLNGKPLGLVRDPEGFEARDLTPGFFASVVGVAPRTVTKWCDAGRLSCIRLPGGRERRIPVAEAVRFVEVNNLRGLARLRHLAAGGADSGLPERSPQPLPRLLLVTQRPSLVAQVWRLAEVVPTPDLLAAGRVVTRRLFDAAALDLELVGPDEAAGLAASLRRAGVARLLAVVPDDGGGVVGDFDAAWRADGFPWAQFLGPDPLGKGTP